jgi:hypothetical protein
MNNIKRLFYGGIVLMVVSLGLITFFSPRYEMKGLRIACNNDAAGLLIEHLAGENSTALSVVNMSYQQLQDCCSSQTELALSAGNFDLAVLCPDGANELIESGQPYHILGPIVDNSLILITKQDRIPHTVGYMNAREIQKKLVWSNFDKSIEMKPMLPAALPYALERNEVDGVVMDIIGGLQIGGYYTPLPSGYPASVLVVHKEKLNTPELKDFIRVYNKAAAEMNKTDLLRTKLEKKLEIENGSKEVEVWQNMRVKFLLLGSEN